MHGDNRPRFHGFTNGSVELVAPKNKVDFAGTTLPNEPNESDR